MEFSDAEPVHRDDRRPKTGHGRVPSTLCDTERLELSNNGAQDHRTTGVTRALIAKLKATCTHYGKPIMNFLCNLFLPVTRSMITTNSHDNPLKNGLVFFAIPSLGVGNLCTGSSEEDNYVEKMIGEMATIVELRDDVLDDRSSSPVTLVDGESDSSATMSDEEDEGEEFRDIPMMSSRMDYVRSSPVTVLDSKSDSVATVSDQEEDQEEEEEGVEKTNWETVTASVESSDIIPMISQEEEEEDESARGCDCQILGMTTSNLVRLATPTAASVDGGSTTDGEIEPSEGMLAREDVKGVENPLETSGVVQVLLQRDAQESKSLRSATSTARSASNHGRFANQNVDFLPALTKKDRIKLVKFAYGVKRQPRTVGVESATYFKHLAKQKEIAKTNKELVNRILNAKSSVSSLWK